MDTIQHENDNRIIGQLLFYVKPHQGRNNPVHEERPHSTVVFFTCDFMGRS